jgi:hypothetical protein
MPSWNCGSPFLFFCLRVKGIACLSSLQLTEIAHFGADCRFQPCSHVKEIDCAVKAALEEDEIFLSRYESYVSLYQELLEREKSRTHREQ